MKDWNSFSGLIREVDGEDREGKVCWKRDEKKEGELWIKLNLEGYVFKGKVKFVGKMVEEFEKDMEESIVGKEK